MVDSGNTYRDKVSRLVSWGHWFSFFNIIAAMLLGTRYIAYSGWPDSFLGQCYQVLTWIGHFGFLVFAVYVLIIFPASFIITHERLMRLFAASVATIGITALILDLHAYNALGLHLNPMVWDLLQSTDKSDASTHWQFFFIAVPAIFLLELAIGEWLWKKLRVISHKNLGKPITIVFAFCFVISHLIHIWADAFLYNSVTSQRSNFPLSYPMTAKSFLEKYGFLDPYDYQRRRDALSQYESRVIKYPLEPLSFSDKALKKKHNLLFVMVDSLRGDSLDSVLMPKLHQFGQKSLNYRNHYSTGNDDMAGLFGLFYGLPANYSTNFRNEGFPPLLIETLTTLDYQMGLFSASNFSNPIYFRSIFGDLIQGKDTKEKNEGWLADKNTVEEASRWINQTKPNQPWFAYIELDSLNDYEQGGNYERPFQPDLSSREIAENEPNSSLLLKNSYNNAAYYLDGLLEKLLAYLSKEGYMENTVIVITSNHGFEFNDTKTDTWGANSNYSKYQVKVPLIIRWPNDTPMQIDTISSHLDLVPTLMKNLWGVNNDSNTFSSGIDLFDPTSRKTPWILAGDSRDITIIQDDKTILVDKYGNYHVFDSNYKVQPVSNPDLSTLVSVMGELKRFYYPKNAD